MLKVTVILRIWPASDTQATKEIVFLAKWIVYSNLKLPAKPIQRTFYKQALFPHLLHLIFINICSYNSPHARATWPGRIRPSTIHSLMVILYHCSPKGMSIFL